MRRNPSYAIDFMLQNLYEQNVTCYYVNKSLAIIDIQLFTNSTQIYKLKKKKKKRRIERKKKSGNSNVTL